MKRLAVHCPSRTYPILIGRGLLSKVGPLLKPLKLGKKVLIVSNRKIARYFLKKVQRSLAKAGFEVPSPYYARMKGDERDKSASHLIHLWRHMGRAGLERTSTLLALGGGVVGDVAGFAASTYMRGISLVQIPTTLLAQVDSAIGGKTAVNLPEAKNMVGTFYQPKMVLCDVEALRTLSPYDLSNHFAEIIKVGVISDTRLFELLEKRTARFFSFVRKRQFGGAEFSFLETVISRSAKVKAEIVEKDEHETKGLRMILNYGHTFAHAFETVSRYRLPHGRAVAWGMLCAARLARRLGLFSAGHEMRQRNLILQLPGLRASRFPWKIPEILSSMKHDKKVKYGRLRFVLPLRIGKVTVKENLPNSLIESVLREIRREM